MIKKQPMLKKPQKIYRVRAYIYLPKDIEFSGACFTSDTFKTAKKADALLQALLRSKRFYSGHVDTNFLQ